MLTLVIATRNAHKVGEIRAILGDGFRYLTLDDFAGPPEVVEDAGTFAGNATKKAVALARWLSQAQSPRANAGSGEPGDLRGRMFVLADDSGLEVDALSGAPGVHSARFAALDSGQPGNSPTVDNNAKLVRLLRDVPLDQRSARFRCVVALTPLLRLHIKQRRGRMWKGAISTGRVHRSSLTSLPSRGFHNAVPERHKVPGSLEWHPGCFPMLRPLSLPGNGNPAIRDN